MTTCRHTMQIQTRYECCGLEGHTDYDRSLWRLQRLGGVEAIVARTCCHLRNTFDDQAFVNPRPVNESMCQSADVRFHQSYRYRKVSFWLLFMMMTTTIILHLLRIDSRLSLVLLFFVSRLKRSQKKKMDYLHLISA